MKLDFEFKTAGCKRAILLFHGMTGSPFEMKKLGKALFYAGFDVYCSCLPGHGTSSIDINETCWQDWYEYSVQDYMALRESYEEVYLGGLCMGAVLALAIAQEYPEVNGILSLSTTLFYDGWAMPWYSFLIPIIPIAIHTPLKHIYRFDECEPYGIKNEPLRRKIATLQKGNTVALDHYPLSCIHELLKLSDFVQKNIRKVSSPVLVIHAKEDDLTSIKSAKFVYNGVSSEIKEYIELEDSYHMIVIDNERDFVFEKSIDFLNKVSKLHTGSRTAPVQS